MTDKQAPARICLDVAQIEPAAAHPDHCPDGAIRPNYFLKQGRVNPVLKRYQNRIFAEVGSERGESIPCVIGPYSNKTDVKFALDLTWEDSGHGNIERPIRHVDL